MKVNVIKSMSASAIKNHNHRYSIDIPDRIYTALKMKSAIERKSVKDIILSSLQAVFGDDFANLPINEQKEMLGFTGMSAKMFGEWNSEEDDDAFKHLQKYKKNSENS
jgi:UDP-glucose 4-epimerase